MIKIKFQHKTSGLKFEIINVYNRPRNGELSLQPYTKLKEMMSERLVIVGDFNCHDPMWDPFRAYRAREIRQGSELRMVMEEQQCQLMSTPGVATFVQKGQYARQGVIDLVWAGKTIVHMTGKATVGKFFGSDHLPVYVQLGLCGKSS